uniref:Putative secreted protein n=1 Tax=Amblyomma triste TaxID=251400 RepID=A0A023G2S5_AMBTT
MKHLISLILLFLTIFVFTAAKSNKKIPVKPEEWCKPVDCLTRTNTPQNDDKNCSVYWILFYCVWTRH